jgi:hypothetical protein
MGELVAYASPLLLTDFTMIKKFTGVPMSGIRHSGGYHSLTRGNGIDQSELPPAYTAQLLMEVAVAAATCIAAAPAYELTTPPWSSLRPSSSTTLYSSFSTSPSIA